MHDHLTAPVRPTIAVSIAVFREDGRVLLATRTKPPAEGCWSLPGGRLEPGETLFTGALRELQEEVGVQAEMVGFNRHVESIGFEGIDGALSHHFVVASFVGRWSGGEPQAGPEAGEVAWVEPGRLGGMAVTPQLGAVLNSARRIWEAAR